MKQTIWVVVALVMLMAACQKPVEYPVEPRISYNGFTYLFEEDSTFSGKGVISFSYTDGDGDLGLDDSDSLPPFDASGKNYYNLIVDYQRSVNGVFQSVPMLSWNVATQSFDTIRFDARFKRLIATAEPKPISGVMDYELFVKNPFSPDDTIRFAVKIIDRALHESNVIETEPIYTNIQFKR